MAKTIFKYKNRGVSISLMRKERNKNDDLAPTFWRITFNRKHKYYPSGFTFTYKDWDDFANRDLQKHRATRKTIQNFFDKTLRPIIDSLVEKGHFSFEALDHNLGKSDISNINEAFQSKIDSLINENRIGNSTIYKTVKKSLESYKGEKIPFDNITVTFLSKYEKFLSDNGVKTATISLYMRTLRAIINNEGKPYLKDEAYPFGRGKYLIKTSKGAAKVALTLKQIHAIENFECKDGLTELCRDLWLFSFYGSGINYTDMFRMKYTDIVVGELNFVRYKTRNTRNDETYISIPILEPMKRIIQKHANKSKDGLIFPICNECKGETDKRKKICTITHESNKRIKAICKELKNDDGTMMIPNYDLVNNYTARHSYATILNKLRVPESYISQQLGHSTQTVTQGYFNEFDRDLRFEYNSLLLNSDNDKVRFMNVI